MSQQKIGAFRVIPYFARLHIELPGDVHEWIDISREGLRWMEKGPEDEIGNKDFNFDGVNLRVKDVEFAEDEESQNG